MTDAEELLDLANAVMYRRNELLVLEGIEVEDVGRIVDAVALSLRLRQRPDVTIRAIVERWTRFQIVRELY